MSEAQLSGDSFVIKIHSPGTPLFDLRVTLAGVDFILKFDWADREARFYMTIFDASGNVITAGIKLLSGILLYTRETLANAPQGNFLVIDPEDEPPQLADFGLRSQLIWLPFA
jgi:hypothetical protein